MHMEKGKNETKRGKKVSQTDYISRIKCNVICEFLYLRVNGGGFANSASGVMNCVGDK